MMRLFIQAADVWLFRDGKPFDAASDHRARSLFPPYPSTMQGAIRSKELALSKVDLNEFAIHHQNAKTIAEVIGWPGEGYGRLQMHGPFIALRNGENFVRYFCMPSDVVRIEKDGKNMYSLMTPLRDSPFSNNAPKTVNPLWLHRGERIEEASGWLSEEELSNYLKGDTFSSTPTEELFNRESRFGIKLDGSTRGVEEGHLYEVEYIRPADDMGLIVDVEGLESWPASGYLGIGGEARASRYEIIRPSSENKVSMPSPDKDGKTRFKLYFASPAYFKDGWIPHDSKWSRFFSKDVRLVSAAINRLHMIGGARVDLKSQGDHLFQKSMRRYLPAGSVYFFEADGQISYDGVPVTESPEGDGDLGQIGFGQIFIGRWQYV